MILHGIHRDESARGLSPRVVLLAVRRLRRSERGNVTLLFVLFFLVLVSSVALVWNTGRASTAAIHAQTAADTAAYSAALWVSRTMNLVTGTNILIVRNVSGQIIYISTMLAFTLAWIIWAIGFFAVCLPPCIASAGASCACVAKWMWEMAALVAWTLKLTPFGFGAPAFHNFAREASDLHEMAAYWVEELPTLVDAQRRILEQELGCNLQITTPAPASAAIPLAQPPGAGHEGHPPGLVHAPLEPGGNFLPLMLRLFGSDNNLPSYKPFAGALGKALEAGLDAQLKQVQSDLDQNKKDRDQNKKDQDQNKKDQQDTQDEIDKIDSQPKPLTKEDTDKLDNLQQQKKGQEGEQTTLDDEKKTLDQDKKDLDKKKKGLEDAKKLLGLTLFQVAKKSLGLYIPLTGMTWYLPLIPTWLANAAIYRNHTYQLPTQVTLGPLGLERGPATPQEWRRFSVVAVASVEGASSQLVAPGVFGSPLAPRDRVLAYAEAETYNGIDQLFSTAVPLPPPLYTLPLPWRVWSFWGWQWQPRLTRGIHLEDAIDTDACIRQWFEEAGAKKSNVQPIQTRH